jgi:arylsulfatase
VLEFLDEIGEADNTLVMLISDNGTSAEGGPHGTFNEHRFTHDRVDDLADTLTRIDDLGGFRAYNHYPWGWAWAGNTPLKLWKRYSWLGGVRTPLVVRWPQRVTAAGEVRSQFCHAVDLLPTVLEACGVPAPTTVDGHDQQPIDGASLVGTFDDAGAPDPRRTQYFEMLGSRSIYHDGWKATTDHVGHQLTVELEALEGSRDFATDRWSLFRLDDDFAEADDLADQHPDVVERLVQRWWSEAGRNDVLPLEDGFVNRAVAIERNPQRPRHRTTYRPGGGGISEDALPPLGAGFVASAALTAGAEPPEGVLCALGDWSNGWAWYLADGRPTVAFSLFGDLTVVASPAALGAGTRALGLEYDRSGGGRVLRLSVDGDVVGEGELPGDLPFRWQIGGAGLLVGRDAGFPVCDDYAPPFAITVPFDGVTFEIPVLAPKPPPPPEQVRSALTRE